MSMHIVRRTGGGRGVYEIAGQTDAGVGVQALLERKLVFDLAPYLALNTGLKLTNQGGKPRLIREGATIQIQRQLAALLLMPKPIRADNSMGSANLVVQTNAYAIERIELAGVQLNESTFVAVPSEMSVRNLEHEQTLDVRTRMLRVIALWANHEKFPLPISDLLCEHKSIVLQRLPLPERLEEIVGQLQLSLAEVDTSYNEAEDFLNRIDKVSRNLTVALSSKPFVILTGASGTGKSRVTIQMASAFDYSSVLPSELHASIVKPSICAAFVPVGADWVDQRNLLGYTNPFGPKREKDGQVTNTTYEITETLKLMLRSLHPKLNRQPHFLILDEMNLSHVERYFSAFLSILEADRSSSKRFELLGQRELHLIVDVLENSGMCPLEVESAKALLEAGRGLEFPPNLFIVGTVNVDETTYMFSPKVLDRAVVIELSSVHPMDYLRETGGVNDEEMSSTNAAKLLTISIDRNSNRIQSELKPLDRLVEVASHIGMSDENKEAMINSVCLALNGVYKLLKPVGFGFGYRVVNEVIEYISMWMYTAYLENSDSINDPVHWHTAIDNSVLTKVLPKIHGSRRQLGDSLVALASFLGEPNTQVISFVQGGTTVKLEVSELLSFSLSKSREKVLQLHNNLLASNYTTFIS